MTLMAHAVVGAAIASVVPQHPVLVIGLAFASHFVVDAIPHYDYAISSPSVHPRIGAPMRYDKALARDMLTIGSDALVGILLSVLLFASPHTLVVVLLGACAAMLPDPLQFLHTRLRHEPLASLQRFHEWIHTSHRMKDSPALGIVSQLAFLVVVVALAKWWTG
jgi:hypothetical protein